MVSGASDPSRSQGPTVPLMANHFRENEGLQSADYDGRDAPQVFDPESEGLQSVDHDGRNGPQVVDPPPFSQDHTYSQYGYADGTKAEPTVYTDEVTEARKQGKRKWIWIALIALVVAIAVAVGVGVGVGLNRGGGEGQSDADGESSGSKESSIEETSTEE